MYVFRAQDIPKDPEFPADLEKLGYFINDKDQIRQTDYPTEKFRWKINRNFRYNQTHGEAMDKCIRAIVHKRLEEAGLKSQRLPIGVAADAAHVPILTSQEIAQRRRIIVVIGSSESDLGIWSYRSVPDINIKNGSAVDFVKAVLEKPGAKSDTALIIANPGQLNWYCQTQQALTSRSLNAQPRRFALSDQATSSWRNTIPGNANWREHISYVFDNVIKPNLALSSKVDVIGISQGSLGAVEYLRDNWDFWKDYVSGICFADPHHSAMSDLDMDKLADKDSFTAFLSSRGRAYILSSDPIGTLQPGYRMYGCNCYASGEPFNFDSIMPSVWIDMLVWLDRLQEDPYYAENVTILADDMDEETLDKLQDMTVEDEGDIHVPSPPAESLEHDESDSEGPPKA